MKTSVAMCTYNGEKFLEKQLDSILNQSLPVNEIIVCDDKSTDSTVSILKQYKEKHPEIFKIFINVDNLKSVKNFEKAISLCENDIIFLCDQDDIWVEHKVQRMISVFNNEKEISVICTNGHIIDEHDKKLNVLTLWDFPKFVLENGYRFDYFNILNLNDNFCTGATMAFRKEFKKNILPIPTIENVHHDGWIGLVASLQNKLFFLDEKLIYYRKHPSQQIGNVFFENTEKSRNNITSYMSIDKEIKKFKDYKKFLKRFPEAYYRNIGLAENLPVQNEFFKENAKEIKRRFEITYKEMKSTFPLQSFILKISDLFSGKRRIAR